MGSRWSERVDLCRKLSSGDLYIHAKIVLGLSIC
jgi:hypothetical protein